MREMLTYLFLFGVLLFLFSRMQHRSGASPAPDPNAGPKPNKWFKPKRSPMEIWVQVYETASMDEARVLQARIQEEDAECILYEQGKKDIYGNAPKGIGLAVPKTAVQLAQNLINRLLS